VDCNRPTGKSIELHRSQTRVKTPVWWTTIDQ
jgi:hypothetical protein